MEERHKNGHGRILGMGVEIDSRSFLDRTSFVGDEADIWESHLFRSRVENRGMVHSSTLLRSSVTGNAKVLGAFIQGSRIQGGSVRGPFNRLGPLVKGSVVKDHGFVGGGDTVLRGVVIQKNMVVGTGSWKRDPRYVHFDITETDIMTIGITESTDGYAYIGCRRKPMTTWMKKQYLFQKIGHWTDEMRDRIYLTFEEWMDTPSPSVFDTKKAYSIGV
jgi:hypothetical protein